MALTKTITDDKLEVVGDSKNLQIRTATIIKEDGKELSRSFHRRVLQCVSSVQNADNSWTHTDTNVSGESAEIQAITSAVWTNAVKAATRTANEAS